jgi:hypothetical protein
LDVGMMSLAKNRAPDDKPPDDKPDVSMMSPDAGCYQMKSAQANIAV